MEPEEQRNAIAEFCGKHRFMGDEQMRECDVCGSNPVDDIHHIPNYLNDLNAIHEVEKKLTFTQCFDYEQILVRVIEKTNLRDQARPWGQAREYNKIWCATAAQRCEALVKTIGKWKESDK